jgi:hypothetical protein
MAILTPTQCYNMIRASSFDASIELATELELYLMMTQAELMIAKAVGCTQTTVTVPTVASTKEYTRPDALAIERVTYDSVKLKKIDMRQLDEIEGATYGGSTQEGRPVYYYEYGNIIGLSPTPQEIKNVKYYYQAKPAALTNLSAAFTIDDAYAHLIADWCLYKLYTKDQQIAEADRYYQAWEKGLKDAVADFVAGTSADMIAQVHLVETMNGTDLGAV